MLVRKSLVVALLAASPLAAGATCPPMRVYDVAGVTASNVSLAEAMRMLTTGTAWSAEITGESDDVRMSYRNVSGPLDQVIARAVAQAGQAAGRPVSSVSDPTRCVVTINVPAAASVAAAVPPPAPQDGVPLATRTQPLPSSSPPQRVTVLHAGETLSSALSQFAQAGGWTLRWNIDDDYVLDVDLPMPTGDVIEGITWVVKTYQAQGGLEGVVPRFARGNHVAVIEDMRVREAETP